MKKRPDSKAGRSRAADRLLRSLLRTPKSRAGLIAAAASIGVSRNYVFGWLSEQRRDGTVATLKSGRTDLYQMSVLVVSETPAPGTYPSWLEPRTLPQAAFRHVYVDGVNTKSNNEKGDV